MDQQIIPAAQLVPKFQGIRRCSNYAMLQSIPCSPECKIVGQILLDHPLIYALTATVDVPVVYLQKFWKTVSKVPDTKDTIRFKLDTQGIVYTVDMFRHTLQLPMENPDNPFVATVNIEIIESFMHTVSYQGVVDKVSAFYTKFLAQQWQTMFKVFNRYLTTKTSGHDQTKINILQLFHAVVNRTNVDYAALLWWDFMNCVSQKKDVIQYPHFIKLIIADLMKKFPSIPPRLEEDYHSIKDDIMLVSVYTMRNVTVRGFLIPNAFLTKEICATDDYKEYETVFINVVVLMNQLQLGKKRKQSAGETSSLQKSLKVTIKQKQVVEGEKDKESYADKFAASLIHNDDDDSGDRIEPESDKEHPKVVVDYDDNQDEKKDEKKDDEMGSLENRTEKMHTPIPTTPRSPRIILSSDKNINQELTKVHGKVDQVLHEIVPQLAERATNDLIEGNLKRVVANIVIQERDAIQAEVPALISKEFDAQAPQIIEELFQQYVYHNVIQVYPTTTTSTDTTSSADLQQIL
ncbi:hypothetical protein Tco_0948279, partial [Tanacetum coccineum]